MSAPPPKLTAAQVRVLASVVAHYDHPASKRLVSSDSERAPTVRALVREECLDREMHDAGWLVPTDAGRAALAAAEGSAAK